MNYHFINFEYDILIKSIVDTISSPTQYLVYVNHCLGQALLINLVNIC